MRILHLSVLYPPIVLGGAERFTATLAEEQARLGHDVGVVTLGPEEEPAHMHNGVLVHRIGHGNLFWHPDWPKYNAPLRYAHKFFASWNPITRRRVARVIDSFQPDVINSHCMVGFAVDCWKEASRRGVPVVHTLHDFVLFCRNANAFRDGQVCSGICLACRVTEPKRWYNRYVTAVIGVSRDILQRHLDRGFFNHIPVERRAVICSMPPIPVRSRSFRPAEAPFTIGFIGRIIPEKGLEVLLEAVKNLSLQGWRLLIAGKVSPPLSLEALQVRGAGFPVQWLGFVPAEEFYPQIDVLVVPSIWAEPAPLVIHEAFANAVPVVGAGIGGITDLIEQDRTGWLCPAGDVAALAETLTQRIRAGREALPPESAFARFRSETTPERVAEHYENVYQSAIDVVRRAKQRKDRTAA
jgi:glycosyltransferase involved in cell wall biosynthesis